MYFTKHFEVYKGKNNKYFLVNGISGSVDVLSGAQAKLFRSLLGKKLPTSDNNDKFIDFLKQKGYIFNSPKEEQALFFYICKEAERFYLSTPPIFEFVVNTFCNFNCIYCFETESLRNKNQMLTEEQINHAFVAIDKIISEKRGKSFRNEDITVGVFGGEPLLPSGKRVLSYLLKKIAAYKFQVYFLTNGYFVESFIDLFKQYYKNISFVQVTLDGSHAVHNRRRSLKNGGKTFETIVAGVDLLLKNRINTVVRMNLDQDNLKFISQLRYFVLKKGWHKSKYFRLSPALVENHCGALRDSQKLLTWDTVLKRVLPYSKDFGKGPFDLSAFKVLDYFRKYFNPADEGGYPLRPRIMYCAANALMRYEFHPDGYIYPCTEIPGVRKFAIGKYSPYFRIFKTKTKLWENRTILRINKCRNCNIASFCGGGCALAAYTNNNSIYKPVCDDAHEVVKTFLSQI